MAARIAVLALCLALGAGVIVGCGGGGEPEKPTVVTSADLNKDGHFWKLLTPDLKDDMVRAGKDKLGEERPDGAVEIAAVDADELITEIDKQYANASKLKVSIYQVYSLANDLIAQARLNELLPQLQNDE